MSHLQITFAEYGLRGIGWKFSRWPEDQYIGREGTWYPPWTLYLGPVIVRRLTMIPYTDPLA